MSKREKIADLLQNQADNLKKGDTLDLAFTGAKEYIKQTIYTEAKKLLEFPITVTITDTGLQIKRRSTNNFNVNIITASPRIGRSLDPSLDPNDLD